MHQLFVRRLCFLVVRGAKQQHTFSNSNLASSNGLGAFLISVRAEKTTKSSGTLLKKNNKVKNAPPPAAFFLEYSDPVVKYSDPVFEYSNPVVKYSDFAPRHRKVLMLC